MILKFFAIFKVIWLERMAYRMNFFLQILSGILSSLFIVLLWMAVFRSAGRELIGGYSLPQMVTYLLGAGLINTFILATAENPETSLNIQDGTLSFLFLQPISPYGVWLIRDLGGKTFNFSMGIAGYGLVFFFFRQYLFLPSSSGYLLVFLLSLIMAAFLQFFLFEALSLLSFWVENTYGIRFTMRVVLEVLGGSIIPVSLFPTIFHSILMLLPFQYLIYLPMEIYLGKIPLEQTGWEFLKEAGWISVLGLINYRIWKRGVRQYVAMGD